MKTPLRLYAHAYLAAAQDHRAAVVAFDTCVHALEQTPPLRAFLANTSIPAEKRREALELAAPKQPETTYHFFLLLAKEKRLRELHALGPVLRNEVAAAGNTRHARVTSAIPLPAPVLRRITDTLQKKFHQDIWLESRVDPSIIAGLHIQAGDWTFDATRRGRLNRLAQTLTV